MTIILSLVRFTQYVLPPDAAGIALGGICLQGAAAGNEEI